MFLLSSRSDALYRANILDHYKSPHHWGKLPSPDASTDGSNPTCGDALRVELKLKNGKISNIAFSGSGCAISVAAASMLADEAMGKSIEAVRRLPASRLLELLGIDPGPSRLNCALLSYRTLQNALAEKNQAKQTKR